MFYTISSFGCAAVSISKNSDELFIVSYEVSRFKFLTVGDKCVTSDGAQFE